VISLDTSVLLRYLLNDDPILSPRALEIIDTNECLVTRAALTEAVYTLESYYRFSRTEVGRAISALLAVQRVSMEDAAVTARAVTWYAAGMDFGDALIAASSRGCTRVVSFDRDFARMARKLKCVPGVEFAAKTR
jgi:predicted nucleic-acid-binding protein